MTVADSEILRQELLKNVTLRQAELQSSEVDAFGQRYVLDFELITTVGSAIVRSAWIVLAEEQKLRLTSCYVL